MQVLKNELVRTLELRGNNFRRYAVHHDVLTSKVKISYNLVKGVISMVSVANTG